MRSLSSISAAFLLLALGAAAQAAAPQAKPAATAAAPAAKPVAPEPVDDPAKVAAAREFISLYHPKITLEATKKMLDAYIPRAVAMRKKQDPKFDAKAYEAELRPRVMKGTAEKLELQARVVSRHFTLHELQALTLFFKAPLGKKLVDETPKIQRDMLLARRKAGINLPGQSYNGDDEDDEDEDKPKPPVKPRPKK